jgi:serine/threonine-protein kinase HSL1 (negative regulator of Swe1 kinase)
MSKYQSTQNFKYASVLTSNRPNEQKLFYSLLVKYRDAQLENYAPDVGYSASDYHHTKPFNLTKTYSTCHFQPTKLKGHARQTSKFTVISNGGDTERSYDPFKASRPQHLNHPHSGHVTVTIHHEENSTRIPRPSTASRPKSQTSSIAISNDHQRQQSLAPPKFYSSRSSMASSTRSRSSNPHLRAGLGYKRGVSFSHVRRNSAGTQLQQFDISTTPTRGSRHRNNAESTKDSSDMVHKVNNPQPVTQYIRSKKAPMGGSRTLPSPVKPGRVSLIWSEDVRKLSTSLAKDCDEAFNRTSVVTEVDTSEISGPKTKTSTLSKFNKKIETPSQIGSKSSHPQAPTLKGDHMSLKDRPLPRAPARTESVEMELKEAKKLAEQRQKAGNGDSFHYLDRMVSHIDELIQPLSPGRARRVISAPVDTKRTSLARPLPSIHEAQGENPSPGRRQGIVSFQEHNRRVETKNNRTASAPEPRDTGRLRHDHRYTEPNPLSRETIRVVTSTSFESPVKPPAPLFIRKKSSQTGPTTTMPGVTGVERDDQPNWERASGTSSWGLFQECNQDTQPNWHQPLKVGLREEFKAADCKTHPNWHRLSGVSLQGQNQTAARTPIGEDRSLTGEEHNDEYDVATESTSGTVVKKRSGWFKRSPKLEEEGLRASLTDAASALNSDIIQSPYERPANPDLLTPNIQAPKKKGFSFGRIFKKRNSKLDMALSSKFTCAKLNLPSILIHDSSC